LRSSSDCDKTWPNPILSLEMSLLKSLAREKLIRRIAALAWLVIGIAGAYIGAFALRFDFSLPVAYRPVLWSTLPVYLVVSVGSVIVFRLYRGLWSYFSFRDCRKHLLVFALATVISAVIVYFLRGGFQGYPRSVFLNYLLLLLMWEIGGRLVVRSIRSSLEPNLGKGKAAETVFLVGSLKEADQVLRTFVTDRASLGRVVGVVTDDSCSKNETIQGYRVLGRKADLAELVSERKPDSLLILPPYTAPKALAVIVEAAGKSEHPVEFRSIPSMRDLASGQLDVSSIRTVGIEDLLQREPNTFDRTPVVKQISGSRVVVTGAGGSIGSEICRQVAATSPSALVLVDHSEFSLFEIEREIVASFPSLKVFAVTGDVKNEEHLTRAMRAAGGVDVVYHAAAYKHVHLMEQNVPSAFENNVLGSYRCADVASREGAKHFILVSTDKAVRPTSIMGASKRLAERSILERGPCPTRFVAVRFGNVLGSSGSVIPIFKKQIADGGPVTVTTEHTRRFFMTIPEAVELVLMAGAVGEDRSVMVLEMGEQVKIVDLAKRLIELSGFRPGEDIEIDYIGLRPGEKEYEELLTEDEDVVETEFEKIWMMRNSSDHRSPVDLAKIQKFVGADDADALRELAAASISEHYLLDGMQEERGLAVEV